VRSSGLILLLLLGMTRAVGAAPAEGSDGFRLLLEPPVPRLGERARLTVEAEGDSVPRPVGEKVAVLPTADPKRFIAIPLRVGVAEIFLPGGSDTLRFSVPAALDPDSLPPPRPLHGLGIVHPVWWPTILLGAAILLPPLVFLYLRSRRRPVPAPGIRLVAEAAHKRALARLQELEDARWIERGELERFYVEASHALRDYVARRYRVAALDSTRRELGERLVAAGYPSEDFRELLNLLAEADAVKFAAELPTEQQAHQWLDRARDWIVATKVELVFTTSETVAAIHRLQGEGA